MLVQTGMRCRAARDRRDNCCLQAHFDEIRHAPLNRFLSGPTELFAFLKVAGFEPLCTAYSDHSWEKMLSFLGFSDRLVILKKPFGSIEVLQLAIAMTEKWRLHQQVKLRPRLFGVV